MKIKHIFTNKFPSKVEPNILYISVEFRTACHLCFCGCGEKVVTPIRPPMWTLIYDGSKVSLYPSIGNWALKCKSHYWIKNDSVIWARKYSDKEILKNMKEDRNDLEKYLK